MNYEFQDNLDETFLYIKQQLARAAVDVKHDLRRIYIATFGSPYPEVRTVVLRAVSWDKNEVTFHTDLRSKKYSELLANHKMSLMGYNHQKSYQIRVRGEATLHHKDEIAEQNWRKLGVSSRRVYLATNPGDVLNQAGNGLSDLHNSQELQLSATESGFDNFVCVTIAIRELEWLLLARNGHRRALYKFVQGQAAPCDSQWICP
jgi:pyridoxine/pyridoxamine 5'-phosphate oxidase